MRRDTKIQAAAGAVLILCLGASAVLTPAIAASASRYRLTYTTAAEEGAPPEVALGIAMGAFRGLFVNFLWIRANQLKEDGKYYEAVDLAKTITRLQPRFPRVWVFHAWNLAYNISVTTQTREERWQWVKAGIDLLRDEGIPANPNDPLIHKELAWIFLHKVQHIMDDANHYYKQRLAEEWTYLIGSPPPTTFLHDSIELRVGMLTKIRDAANTLDELEAGTPGAAELVQQIRTTSVGGRTLDLDIILLQIFEKVRLLGPGAEGMTNLGLPEDLVRSINDPAKAPVWDALIAHIRKHLITDQYHMELDRMIRYTKEYGPLDWRHPAAHALYWSKRGVERALLRTNEQNKRDYDFLNTDRITLHAVQELFRTGTVYFNVWSARAENDEFAYLTFPNMEFVDDYEKMMKEVSERNIVYDDEGKAYNMNDRVWNMYTAGYENFLRDVVRVYYRRGQRDKAQEYLTKLLTYSKTTLNNPNADLQAAMTLDEFVENEVRDGSRYTSPEVALQEVSQSLLEAYFSAMAGDADTFHEAFNYARNFHQLFTSRQVFNTGVNQGGVARMEVMPKYFDIFAGRMLALMIMSLPPVDAARLYDAMPTDLRQRGYYFLEKEPSFMQWKQQAAADQQSSGAAAGPAIMFPEPEGMAAVRRDLDNRTQPDLPVGTMEPK
jgi:hypothetical protein